MSRDEGMSVNCSTPIDSAVLADYWLALLVNAEEERVEQHLLSCDECGARLREVIALADGIRNLAREGSLRMIVSDRFLERARQEGLRVREYTVPPGGGVQCTVAAEDDVLIGRLAANLSGAGRVDLLFCNEHGIEQLRLPDIPVHAGTSSVLLQESITSAKAAPTNKMIARLVTLDEGGEERLLGEYTFNHTRTMPGGGSWKPG
jgi:hypothetical protein